MIIEGESDSAMKIVFPFWKSFPFMIDDQNKRHNLRFWIRWLCWTIAFVAPRFVVPLIYEHRSGWGILLEALIHGVLIYIIIQICASVVYLTAKLGCIKVFKPDATDMNDPF